jgi:hypothetical protein
MGKSILVRVLSIISRDRFHIEIVSILYVPVDEGDVHAESRTNICWGTNYQKKY